VIRRAPAAFLMAGSLIAGTLYAGTLPATSQPAGAPHDAATDAVAALLRSGHYEQAVQSAQAAFEAAERAAGPGAAATVDAIDRLVEALWRYGRAVEPPTRALAERAVAIREARPGDGGAGLATSLTNLGIVRGAAAEFPAGQEALERALALREAASGPEARETAIVRERLATIVANTGRTDRALALLGEAAAALERAPGTDAADQAAVLTSLGGLKTDMGDLRQARELLGRALAMRESTLGPEHPETASTLFRLAILDRREGNAPAALALARRSLAIREAALAPGCPDIAAVLTTIANLRFDQGDLPGARVDAERALEMRRATLGPRHPGTASSLKTLASILWESADYAAARPLFEQALAIEQATLGPDHPRIASSLANLGAVLSETGDLAAALDQYERALAITQRKLPPGHPETASIVMNLANALARMGRVDEAVRRLQDTLSSVETALGPDHPLVARLLHSLGQALDRAGDLDGAAQCLTRAGTILEAAWGKESPRLAYVHSALGEIRQKQGQHAVAGDLFARSLLLLESGPGADHPLVVETLNSRGLSRWRSGDFDGALEDGLRAEEIRREYLHKASGYLSEREAMRYRSARADGLDLALSRLAGGGTLPAAAPLIERTWDGVVRSRAQVLDEIVARQRMALEAADAEVGALLAALEQARTRFAQLAVQQYDPGRGGADPAALPAARADKERLERVLAARSAIYRETESLRATGFEAVRSALPPRSALVAYVLYSRHPAAPPPAAATAPAPAAPPADGVPSYMALVLRAGDAAPVAAPLDTAGAIDALVRAWRREAGAIPGDAEAAGRYRVAADGLAKAVWRPIAGLVEGADLVLLVPDGALQFVSWTALPGRDGRFIVEGAALVHLLSAERDIVHGTGDARDGHGVLAMGGPDFDAAVAAVGPEDTPRPRPVVDGAPARAAAGSSGAAPCAGAAPRFQVLPSAAAEARDVGALWKVGIAAGAGEGPVTILTGAQAGEAQFRALAPGRRVLHLATHGFFLDSACGRRDPGPASAGAATATTEAESALLRTGLALAGANHGWGARGIDGAHDGLVTSEEIAAIDLRGVDWVVVSACGSSLGLVEAGEGVLGLRRTFEIAGAHSLIASLWNLDDHTARAWIRRLYEARLGGASTAAAVRAASLETLNERRRQRLNDHPYYWAPFVAVGDWR